MPCGATAGEAETPHAAALTALRPNPASDLASLTLTLTLDAPQHVRAMVVDALGRTMAVPHEWEGTGALALTVDEGRLAPGVYVARVEAGAFSAARRLTVVR